MTMTLVSSSGSQMMGAVGGAFKGSTGKSQPPSLPDQVHQRIGSALRQRLEIPAVSFASAEPFPGKAGCRQVLNMIVARRGAPQRCVGRQTVLRRLELKTCGETSFLGLVVSRKIPYGQQMMPLRQRGDYGRWLSRTSSR